MANKKLTDLPAISSVSSTSIFLVDDGGTTQTANGTVIKSYITGSDMTLTGNLLPTTSNTYTLGSPTQKWADVYIGPNSIHLEDTANAANVGNLTVTNGILQINGVAGLQANLISGNTTLTLAPSGNINLSVAGNANVLQVTGNAAVFNSNVTITANTGNTATRGINLITADGNYLSPQNPGVMLQVTGQTVNPARVYIDGVGSNNYAAVIGRHYNGTTSVPTGLMANDIITRYGGTPYTANGWPAISTTRIDMVADENQTGTTQGSRIEFWLTPTGANTIQKQVTFNTTGANINGNLNVSGDITVSGNINLVPGTFGQFANVANITAPGSNTPATILWTTSIASNGVSYTSGNSRITVNKADTYRISYNTSMLGNGASPIGYFWLRKNGTDIPNSMTTAATTGTVQHQVTGTVVIALASSDYIELAWAVSDNTKATLVAYAANSTFTHPASPSASISILPVSV